MEAEWRFPNRATPLGSSAYYAVRFAPPGLRDPLALLCAWRGELRDVLSDCSDPGVARLKLQWWREELERARTGEALHPLTKALTRPMRERKLPAEPFLAIADTAEADLRQQRPADLEALAAHCARDLGSLFELEGRCHGLAAPDELAALRRLGAYGGLVYLIRDLGAHLRRDRNPLPLGHAPQGQGADRWLEPLRALATHARSLHDAAWVHTAPPGLAVRSAIFTALLDELERSGFPVLDQRVGLTPLRKLWIGWRTSRRNRFEPRP